MKLQLKTFLLALVVPSMILAQPPEEEVAPVAPEFNIEVTEIPVEPAPVVPSQAPENANANISPELPTAPITTPTEVAPPAVEEDNSVKGITLAPAFKLYPIAMNNAKQGYIAFIPSVALSSIFKTPKGRDVGLSFEYYFEWDEFFNQRDTNGSRFFEHGFIGSADVAWNNFFSTNLSSEFYYGLTASTTREAYINVDNFFTTTFKIMDNLSVSPGYRLFYFNDLDSDVVYSDLPSGPDDVRSGNAAFGGANPFALGPFGNPVLFDPAVASVWFANNGLRLGAKYSPIDPTTLKLTYEYVFSTFTNEPNTAWKGHWLTGSISQKMPWEGGSLSLTEQIRIRNYDSKSTSGTATVASGLASDFRNRLTLKYGQAINDSISVGAFYRWELTASNNDNYAAKRNVNRFYIYTNFTF